MEVKQLNMYVRRAKLGDEEALWSIIYHFQAYIHQLSERNRNFVRNQADFEEDCFKRVREAVGTFDVGRGSFEAHVEAKLHERLNRWKKRNLGRCQNIETTPITNEEGVDIEIKDDLAVVDRDYLFTEKITLLAEGDPKKLVILNEWSWPDYNDSNTAKLLAQQDGGKSESHRKYIIRFRTRCQEALAHAN